MTTVKEATIRIKGRMQRKRKPWREKHKAIKGCPLHGRATMYFPSPEGLQCYPCYYSIDDERWPILRRAK